MRLQTVLDGSAVLAQEHLSALCQRLQRIRKGLLKIAHALPSPLRSLPIRNGRAWWNRENRRLLLELSLNVEHGML